MRQLPTGTVTFLFTDIEGSTRLLHELGDAYAQALAEHRRALREAFARHDGSRSTPRAMPSSSPSPARATRSRRHARRSAPSIRARSAPERIYQLGEREFPPLKSLYQSTLPVQPTPFVAREKELGEVLALLREPETRLLTLTGPGGSGKTRLAVQAAAEVVDEHEHDVWWVPLQEVRSPTA